MAGIGKESFIDQKTFTRLPHYQLTYYGGINFSSPFAVARYDETGRKLVQKKSKRKAARTTIDWPSGKVPRGSPKCGWDRNLCDLKLSM